MRRTRRGGRLEPNLGDPTTETTCSDKCFKQRISDKTNEEDWKPFDIQKIVYIITLCITHYVNEECKIGEEIA